MAKTINRTETYIGIFILFLLVIIAGGIFIRQFQYSPAILKPGALLAEKPNKNGSRISPLSDPTEYAPTGLVPLSKAEIFGPESLSDKIDGKAELYLSGGFVQLVSQRFTTKEDPGAWMEVFVYNMGSIRGAFAVYSLQQRFDAEKIDLGEFSYRTENALFLVHGPYYVEIIGAVSQEKLTQLMFSLGSNFVVSTVVDKERINELALFPPENLDKATISLLPTNAFGFERFDSVFTANYTIAGTEMTAFLSERKSSAEATELAKAYSLFLVTNGGREVKPSPDIPGARLVEIMDTFELVYNHGKILAGVHGAENKETAERLALILKKRLVEVGR